MAGIAITDNIVSKFNELKLGKTKRFCIFKISDDLTEVVFDTDGGRECDWNQFQSNLPKTDCRYGIFDFEFQQEGGDGARDKLLFVLWAPDEARIKTKMLYTTTKKDLIKALVGIGAEIQATDASEIDYNTILEKVSRGVK